MANLVRFKYCYYTHLGKTGRGEQKKKSLSNLRTPKQRNCKILNCKAKETHLIPQEFKYVFQLGYTIPHKDMEAHKNLETQYSHCEAAGRKPTGCSTHQPWHLLGLSSANALHLLGARREGKYSTKCPFSSKKCTTVHCESFKAGFPAAKQASLNAGAVGTLARSKATCRNT